MKRALREAFREEDEKAKLYAEMPLRDLERLAHETDSNKCEHCYLCIEHSGCLLDHPPPSWCAGARHHYLWRTRERACRSVKNGPFCIGCGNTVDDADTRDDEKLFCYDCIDASSRMESYG